MVKSQDGDAAFLVVSALGELPAGRQYQVWRINGGTPQGVGLFSSAGSGEQIFTFPPALTDADAIGISIEPAGGSLAPTGPIVLLGA